MNTGSEAREYWIEVLEKLANPVLQAAANKQLKQMMPCESLYEERKKFTHLEALARLLVGIAPWLEIKQSDAQEEKKRNYYADLARKAMDAGTDPESPDYMNFEMDQQPICDGAFLSQAILRAPTELWEKLDERVKKNVVQALKKTRTRNPAFNNWLCFSAIIETLMFKLGEDWDRMRIDYALRQMEQWYIGDGAYKDGMEYRWDYYNSFVIVPMLLDMMEHVSDQYHNWLAMKETIEKRAIRQGVIQERMISPEGTYPVIGRSLAYRFGAFQLLSTVSLKEMLDPSITPAQVRCALTAVIKKSIEMPGTFDSAGWLQIGICGHQPEVGERYISTGSLYLCSTILLPLGLTADNPFWKDPDESWTSKKTWEGQPINIDVSLGKRHPRLPKISHEEHLKNMKGSS